MFSPSDRRLPRRPLGPGLHVEMPLRERRLLPAHQRRVRLPGWAHGHQVSEQVGLFYLFFTLYFILFTFGALLIIFYFILYTFYFTFYFYVYFILLLLLLLLPFTFTFYVYFTHFHFAYFTPLFIDLLPEVSPLELEKGTWKVVTYGVIIWEENYGLSLMSFEKCYLTYRGGETVWILLPFGLF